MKPSFPVPVSQLLPLDSRMALVTASMIDPGIEVSSQRIAAISHAVQYARRRSPQLFSNKE